MTWKPNIVTRQAIQGFISDLFATAPEIMGIDEAISACEVILMDPYATGALPRYIRVRVREYYQDVMWRGNPSLVVGDFCTVLHLRDGNRYEVIGASGASGIDLATPYITIWVYDVSLGLIIPYDTINNALGYAALAAGDFILIPPGTFNESVTLVNGVFICEQIPGTVTITYTGAPNALSGTVVVADGGYLNVRNVHRTVNGSCNAVYAGAAFTAACTIIVENIVTAGGAGNLVCGARMNAASGTLHLHAKTITATTTGTEGSAVRCLQGGNGTLNLYVEQGYGTGTTRGYGVRCGGWLVTDTFTVNVYGGVWEGSGAADAGFYCSTWGIFTALHARAIGSVQDIFNVGTPVMYIFQVQYDTVTGPAPTHLPGDHIVLDLDADTYVSALLADDRIDFYVAGAPATNIRLLANNVASLVDNIAQAFSIADVGGLEYMRIVSTNANPYFLIDPAGAGIKVGIGTATPVSVLELEVGNGETQGIAINNVDATPTFNRIRFEDSGVLLGHITFSHQNNQFELGGQAGKAIQFFTNGAAAVRIDTAGHLGVRETTLIFNLHVAGANANTWGIPSIGVASGADAFVLIGADTASHNMITWDSNRDLRFGIGGATVANPDAAYTELVRFLAGGAVQIVGLAGVGVRAVVAAADGTLSAP